MRDCAGRDDDVCRRGQDIVLASGEEDECEGNKEDTVDEHCCGTSFQEAFLVCEIMIGQESAVNILNPREMVSSERIIGEGVSIGRVEVMKIRNLGMFGGIMAMVWTRESHLGCRCKAGARGEDREGVRRLGISDAGGRRDRGSMAIRRYDVVALAPRM